MQNPLLFIKAAGLAAKKALSTGLPRQEALNRAAQYLQTSLGAVMPAESMPYYQLLSLYGISMGLAWCECGFPVLQPGHRLAASLMCTSLAPSLANEVQLPWRAFAIAVPPNLISPVTDALFVAAHTGRKYLWTFGDGGYVQFGEEPDLAQYCDLELSFDETRHPAITREAAEAAFPGGLERQARVEKLLGRLLVGLCLELDTLPARERIAAGPLQPSRKKKSRRPKDTPPANWTFQVTRPVKVDVRDVVVSYVTGETHGKLSLQQCVRGHHKRQAYGPGFKDRKWIHIEPYWRGDPDSPIALRAHELGSCEDV